MSGYYDEVNTLAPEGIVISRLDMGQIVEPNRCATAMRVAFTSMKVVPCQVVVKIDRETLEMIEAESPFHDSRKPFYTEKKTHVLLVADSFQFLPRPRACNKTNTFFKKKIYICFVLHQKQLRLFLI